jgi:drug/metabolite transporter (DMT)-like permease
MGNDILNFDADTAVGALFCALGAVCYGVFTALNQKYYYNKRISLMINYFVTFALTSVINGVSGNLFIPTLPEALGFAYNGMFSIAIANTLWMIALESGETAKISNLAYMTPFISLIWTSLVLKEPFRIELVIGLVVIVAGIFLQLKDKKK